MKIIYTRPEDNGVNIVVAASKESVERVLGALTQEQYEQHVWEKSVPADAINPRILNDADIPGTREFRNAWVDVSALSQIDIDLVEAKKVQLTKLRAARDAKLKKLDTDALTAMERDDGSLAAVKAKKQALRDATNALKQLEVSGINDADVLNNIRTLGTLSQELADA